jgi:hypothetical protein
MPLLGSSAFPVHAALKGRQVSVPRCGLQIKEDPPDIRLGCFRQNPIVHCHVVLFELGGLLTDFLQRWRYRDMAGPVIDGDFYLVSLEQA